MAKLRSVILAGMALALLLALFPVTAGAAPVMQEGNARVRFVHASFDSPSLDAYVDGTSVASGVRGETGYMDVPAGEHLFSWRTAGGTEDVATVTLSVAAGQRVTIAAMNSFSALEARSYVDDVTAPARNRAKIKVIHAVADGGPVSASIGDLSLADGLAYGEAGEPGQMYAGSHDIVITGEDGTALVTETGKPINEDRAYTMFVVGSAAAGAYRVVTIESTVLPPEPTSQFQFGNFAQGISAVNVHINKEPSPLYQDVAFANVQQFFAAGLGPYLIELYAPGTSPDNGTPLASGTFMIEANQSVLFVAQGTADELEVGAYAADVSPVAPQSSRLTVVNLAVGNPPFEVERLEGGVLIDEALEVYGAASTEVSSGSHNIRFTDASTGETMMEKGGIQMADGTVTMLVAFDDNPADPLINAVPVSNQVSQYAAVRWAHMNIYGPPVDIYMDGVPVVTSLVYKMKTEYMVYEPKVYTLAAYTVGSDPTTAQPLSTLTLELGGANFPRTIFIYGQPDQAQFGIAPDNLTQLPAGSARIRFINAAIDVPGVAIFNSFDGAQIVGNLPFGVSSDNFNVSAGTYSYNFVADFGAVTQLQGLTVEEGKIYTVVLGGIASESPGAETFVLIEER